MNLVGKILVVALLVMSVVFASFVLVVHATHTNWMLRVSNPNPKQGEQPGLVQEIALRDANINRLNADIADKTRLYERTLRESEQVRGQLESLNQQMQQTLVALRDQLDTKAGQLTAEISAAKTAADVLTKTQKENGDIRTENTQVRSERDKLFDELLSLNDQLAQAAGEWARLEQRNRQLLGQLAQFRQVIQDKGWSLNLEKPTVEGLVTQTHTAERMAQINLGSDDGLKPGDTMDVVRVGGTLSNTHYLGKIRLTTVNKTEAVGSVIPGSLKGTIQKDDTVTTALEMK
jgi:small-conductance mechanosensitive channel